MEERLFRELNKEDLKVLQKLIDKRYGEYQTNILSSLIEGIIPYFGNTLGTLIEGRKRRSLYDMNYTFFFPLLPNMFKALCKNQKIGIFIDGAQYISKQDYTCIERLSDINNLYFVFGITNKDRDISNLKCELRCSEIKSAQMSFSVPTEKLVQKLAEFSDKSITLEDAKDILEKCSYDIYEIKCYLQKGLILPKMNQISNAVIYICAIIPNNIKISKVKDILLTDTNLINVNENFESSLNSLIDNDILEIKNSTFKLVGRENIIVKNLMENSLNRLYYKNVIYNYYKNSSPYSLEELDLIYSLAVELEHNDEQSTKWLYQIIYSRLHIGLTIERNLISDLLDTENVKLLIIVYTYNRNYESALKYIKELMKSEKLSFNFQKLYAVLLNRCRRHKKAKKKLLKCLKKEPDNFIIMSYLASNYVHQEKLSKAQKLYEKVDSYKKTLEKGYFYRNIAAAFWDKKAPFEKALKIFTELNDPFGYYTTLCNYLMRKILWNQCDEDVEKQFFSIEKNLKQYGSTNLHILYNNWGIYYLLTKDDKNARKHFSVALSISKNSMPSIFIQINQACLELQCGEKEKAKAIIDSLESVVKEHSVNRVKQKYYLNKALIYYANGIKIDDILEQCAYYPERYNSNYTKELIQWYQHNQKNGILYEEEYWSKAYLPCYLEYWYVNPLKLFSTSISDEILPV